MSTSYQEAVKDRVPSIMQNMTGVCHVIDDDEHTRSMSVLLLLMILGERKDLPYLRSDSVPVPPVHEELIFLLASLGPMLFEMPPCRVNLDGRTDDVHSIEDVPTKEPWVGQK